MKVVKDGWDSLSMWERSNPILEILREVDQHLFWDLDPITKIADIYKSMLILKLKFIQLWECTWVRLVDQYYFNAGTHNLEKMPEWQRPV